MNEKFEPVIRSENRIPCVDDFVFLDDLRRAYRVRRMLNDGLWLLYWNDALKCYLTLRRMDEVTALKLYLRRALNAEDMVLFEGGLPFLTTT